MEFRSQIDSLRDSTKRNIRNSNSIAPHARGETSSSSSLSESSDSSNQVHGKETIGKAKISKSTKRGNDNGVSNQLTEQNYDQKQIDSGTESIVKVPAANSFSRKTSSKGHAVDSVDCSNVSARFDAIAEPLHSLSKIGRSRMDEHKHLPSTSASSSSTTSSPSFKSSSPSSTSSSEGGVRTTGKSISSMPTSPTSHPMPIADALLTLQPKDACVSAPTSPESSALDGVHRRNQQTVSNARKCDVAGFRTSRSEDHLQHTQKDILGANVPIDADEDVNSSLNTLLDTRGDSEDSPCSSDRDRIVWTYNAPVVPSTMTMTSTTMSPLYHNSQSFSSSMSSSPQHSGDSLASPTSVSSSIMSSNSGSKDVPVAVVDTPSQHAAAYSTMNGGGGPGGAGTDLSISEAVSNISSPDYQDDDNLLSSRDIAGMAISDPSDSDSTILVSDINSRNAAALHDGRGDHKIVIKVKGVENQTQNIAHTEFKDSEDDLATITEDVPTSLGGYDKRDASPPVSDDGSDVDSLHSYHYSPKAVDIPSAVRLAKRLFGLEGFKKSDVSRHLSKK